MSVFLVAYDLVKEETSEDYEPLWDELKRLDAHKTQLSLWPVNVNNSARELVDHLKGFVDSNDRLWATRLHRGEPFRQRDGRYQQMAYGQSSRPINRAGPPKGTPST